jgi:hypothetical protein
MNVMRPVIVLCLLLTTPAWADSVVLDAGAVSEFTEGSLTEARLTATGQDFWVSANGGPFNPLFTPCVYGCAPGVTALAGMDITYAFGGSLVYQGVAYLVSDAPSSPGVTTASWNITAEAIAMPALGLPFSVSEPFALTANFHGGGLMLSATGAGIATWTFASSGGVWVLTGGTYTLGFDPAAAAEPGTWLLMASGLGGLFARWRRRS